LDDVFDNDENAIGKGVVNFYKYICTKYVGVTRKEVSAFLATKGKYQMTQDINKRVNKPIISKFPNQIWGIDLIDMNEQIRSNHGWRYIVTIVDIFSRKVFLTKLKYKEAVNTRDALKEVIDANVKPKYLLSDKGKEWEGRVCSIL
jgi:IS30 family transposase